jgi:predicted Zn-dependent protease
MAGFYYNICVDNPLKFNNMERQGSYMRFTLSVILILLIPSCAVNPVTGKKQLMFMSESQEIQMGSQYDPQVVATFGEYKNEVLQSFINQKGSEMGLISHRPKLKYHFKILDTPVVNAFAVPGGYIYLTRGILAQLNNEAELVGIIGHEMGHITARHSASQQSKQQLSQVLLIGGMIASPRFAQYGQYAMQGMQLLFLKFSRDNEVEADSLGVEYSSKIGYDAHKMADFFQVLDKMSMTENVGGVPTFLSTHPNPADRYNSVNQKASHWQSRLNKPNWMVNQEAYLHMIDGIIYGPDPRQGYTEGNTFYHPELKFKFSFPAGWKFENQPAQVNMAPEDGKALIVFLPSSQKTIQAAADSTAQRLGLVVEDRKNTTINGLPAITMVSKQVSKDQSTGQETSIFFLSCFIEQGINRYAFHGISTETDFKNYTGPFESAMKSFSNLTDASKINVKPNKILIKKVVKSGTLADAFKYFGVRQSQMNELALLNNLELTDKVQAGRLIKVVGQ